MNFDHNDVSTDALRKHDQRAIIDVGEAGVIFLNPQLGDDVVKDILQDLLKMRYIDLSHTIVTDIGVQMLTQSQVLRQIQLPRGISAEVIQALLQMPKVRGVRVEVPSPPVGYEAVAEWAGCVHSTQLTIRQTPKVNG